MASISILLPFCRGFLLRRFFGQRKEYLLKAAVLGGKCQHGAAGLGQRPGHGGAAVGGILALGGKGDLTVCGAFQFYLADARYAAHSGQHGVSLALRGSAQTAAGIQSLAQLRSRNLRMVNRRADIYLENTDGTSEDYVTEDMAPFDLSGGHLDVPDNDYGIWYVDMMDNPQRYDGVTVRYKALMCHSKKFPGIHCPGRFAMVCCNNDMQFLALVCKGEGLEKFKNRQWVEIQATVKKEQCQAYDGEGPVLYVTGVKPCQKPDPENVNF